MTKTDHEEETFLTVKVEKKITPTMVKGLLCGLFENNYSSWLGKADWHELAQGLKIDDFRKGGKMQDPNEYWHWLQIVPMTEGCSLKIIVDDPDNEGVDTRTVIIGPEQIKKGLQLMAEKAPYHFNNFIEENDDAETADVFGQFVVYGDLIYG